MIQLIRSRLIRLTLIIIVLFSSSTALEAKKSLMFDRGEYELLDWSLILVPGLVGGIGIPAFSDGAWPKEALIKSGPSNLSFTSSTVPGSLLFAGTASILLLIEFLPNNDRSLRHHDPNYKSSYWNNHTKWRNVKGYLQSMSVTLFATQVAKYAVGRKRPDFDNRPSDQLEDGRLSFWSGHASLSFSSATYFSLYMLEHVGNWDNGWHVALKIGSSIAVIGMAGWVSSTRVKDNKHHTGDVIVGGLVGAGVAFFFYSWQNDWPWLGGERYETKEPSRLGFMAGPSYAAFTYVF